MVNLFVKSTQIICQVICQVICQASSPWKAQWWFLGPDAISSFHTVLEPDHQHRYQHRRQPQPQYHIRRSIEIAFAFAPVQDALELQEFSQRSIVTPSSYDYEGKAVHSSNTLVFCNISADWVVLLALFSLKQMESISQMLPQLKYGWIAVYVKQPRLELGWESATSNQEALAMQIMIKGCCSYYWDEHVQCTLYMVIVMTVTMGMM